MNSSGLTKYTLNTLKSVFSNYPDVKEVILYGSRAKGNYSKRSDIDLVAKGDMSRHVISRILMELEDSNILNSVDLQIYSELKNKDLINHIDRIGITIYHQ